MRPLYIFDLDGTLALIDHRRHLVERPVCTVCGGHGDPTGMYTKCTGCNGLQVNSSGLTLDKNFKPNWDAFFKACVDDKPIQATIHAMNHLLNSLECDVYIWTGRSDVARDETLAWLQTHAGVHEDEFKNVRMRPHGCFTPDHILKREWLDSMSPYDRKRLTAVFEDSKRVVDMWRGQGVMCFQVAEGYF